MDFLKHSAFIFITDPSVDSPSFFPLPLFFCDRPHSSSPFVTNFIVARPPRDSLNLLSYHRDIMSFSSCGIHLTLHAAINLEILDRIMKRQLYIFSHLSRRNFRSEKKTKKKQKTKSRELFITLLLLLNVALSRARNLSLSI